MPTYLDGHGYKLSPDISKTIALLNTDGSITDGKLGIEYGQWTPTVDGASSYNDQYGYYIRVGNFCIICFRIYGTFTAGDTSKLMVIRGCPIRPVDNFSGGGTLSGYWSPANVLFQGFTISMSGVITPMAHTLSASATDHWAESKIYQKGSGDFNAYGTIACKVYNGIDSNGLKYTNLLENSLNLSKQYIGKTPMYSASRWTSSSGDPTSYSSTFITGLIPCAVGDTIRIRWNGSTDTTYQQMKTYKWNFEQVTTGYVNFANIVKSGSSIAANLIQSDLEHGKLDFTLASSGGHLNSMSYVCFTLHGSIDDCIITVNQEIE